ncbi:hypothetical protein GCM10028771_14130 [Nocardioides marmoraquaticus]
MRERTEAGATAAVKWFLESMSYAGSTGDTTGFRNTFASSCTRCLSIADGIDKTYADGGRIDGGGWTPFRFRYYGTRAGIAFVDASVNYQPQIFVESEDAQPKRFPGRKNVLKAFQLSWEDGWVVGALDPES